MLIARSRLSSIRSFIHSFIRSLTLARSLRSAGPHSRDESLPGPRGARVRERAAHREEVRSRAGARCVPPPVRRHPQLQPKK